MSAVSPGAWAKSLALHGLVVALMFFVAYSAQLNADKPPRIIELVAGPGEDYGATAAPAAGTSTGVKLDIPKAVAPAPTPAQPTPPAPVPTPVQPVQEASPIVPAPTPKKEAPKTPPPKTKEPEAVPNFKRQIEKKVQQADRKAKAQVAADRKKEEEARKKEEAARKKEETRVALSKAEFDAKNKGKTPAQVAKNSPTKYEKLDVKGIAGGVVGGSSASTKGAGGRALTREEATLLELYDSEFLLKLRKAFEEDRPPGLSDSLRVTIEVRSNADGSLTSPRIVTPSGMPEFDRAVLAALRRVRMPPRPDKKSEPIEFVFTMREG